MLTSEIKEGNKISVIVNKLEFDSEIQIIGDGYILAEMITVDGKIVNFPSEMKVNMVYFDDNNLYIWENVSVSPVKLKGGNKYHKIDLPETEGKRYNRRGSYRLFIGKEMGIELKEGTKRTKKKILVKDISATGFAFIINEEYNVGLRVTLFFDMGNGKRIDIAAKIVRKQYAERTNSNLYGCRFLVPSDEIRKMVNREQQRIMQEKLQ